MKYFVVLLLSAVLFVACGDESSSSAPDPIGEISSSSNDDNGSSGKDKDASSSSQKDSKKSSSSVTEKKSSSSEQGYSSVNNKNSSSSVIESSSSSVNRRCEEGALDTLVEEYSTTYRRCVDNRWRTDSTVYKPKEKVYPNMDSLFASDYEPVYSEFEDPRDHQVYKTVILSESYGSADKIEVFAQNLNYGVMIDSSKRMLDDSKVEKHCELNDEWFCDNGWGGQYTWSEAMALPAKYDTLFWKESLEGDEQIHQGICPDGWHIMNGYEWRTYTSSAGLDLASKSNWKLKKIGANSSGMSVLFRKTSYEGNSGVAYFILPKESSVIGSYEASVSEEYAWFGEQDHGRKLNIHYVRCVKDY